VSGLLICHLRVDLNAVISCRARHLPSVPH
jgi:hypothetical protein